jgi:hypothetical protein
MERLHASWHDLSTARGEATTLHKVETLSQLCDKLRNFLIMDLCVGVSHDHISTSRCRNATQESVSVTALIDMNHPSARTPSELGRSVRTAVVRDHDLTSNPSLRESLERALHTECDRISLVEAWHHN